MRTISATDKKNVIITGHYGSGKTEFAVNYAVKARIKTNLVCIADLDIVNMYFRTTERKELFRTLDIQLLECTVPGNSLDLPSLSSRLPTVLRDRNIKTILDAGGDSVGARILRQYRNVLLETGYDMFLIINANRKETQTSADVIKYLNAIESESGLNVTGLVNNTHLLKDTTAEDIYRGHKLALQVSRERGLDVKYEAVTEPLAESVSGIKNICTLHLYMRDGWMS